MANGPNIFQMLLVYLIFISSDTIKVRVSVWVTFNNSHVMQILYCELYGNATYLA